MNKLYPVAHIIAGMLGALEALLAARLLLRLLAARPDNPVFAALFWLTAPFAAALAVLDADQPRFGAVLEFSTLVWMLLVLTGVVVLRHTGRAHRHSATRMLQHSSNNERYTIE